MVYTLNYVANPDSKIMNRQLVEWTDNVEKMEDFTVRIHTKSIFPLAIEYLVNTGVIYPHKYYTEVRPEGINEKPVGTAPYSIAGQKRGRLVSLERLSLEMLASISLLAARETAFVGTIGFMGLVGPHVARMLVGEDQRYFVPVLAAAGTLILSVASTLAKGIMPGVNYPIGIIAALVGCRSSSAGS